MARKRRYEHVYTQITMAPVVLRPSLFGYGGVETHARRLPSHRRKTSVPHSSARRSLAARRCIRVVPDSDGANKKFLPSSHISVYRKCRTRWFSQHTENGAPPSSSFLRVTTLSLLVAPVVGFLYLFAHAVAVLVSAYRRGLGATGGGGNGGFGSETGGPGAGGDGAVSSGTSFIGNDDDEAEVWAIVPALNEESSIIATVRALLAAHPPVAQVIVVDGGSTDETVSLARREGAVVVSSARGRAKQMNEGAAVALATSKSVRRSILCFVHADTLVPSDLVSLLRTTLSTPSTVCGGFVAMANFGDRVLWGMTFQNCFKTWYAPILLRPLSFFRGFRVLFGDQVMFCRAPDFSGVGGFDSSLPIMEDADLCDRLHRRGVRGEGGRIRLLSRAVYTSGRRLIQLGPVRATYVHLVLGLRFAFGASPGEMHRLYKRLYQDIR